MGINNARILLLAILLLLLINIVTAQNVTIFTPIYNGDLSNTTQTRVNFTFAQITNGTGVAVNDTTTNTIIGIFSNGTNTYYRTMEPDDDDI